MLELTNKKVLIIGASGDVGRATSIKLSELGAKIVLTGRDENKLKQTLSMLKGTGHHYIKFDVTDLENIPKLINDAVAYDDEKLTGLVYAAGVMPIRPIKSTKSSFLNEVMTINYFSFIEAVRSFSDKRNSSGGSVVVLSSYASINGEKGQLAYAASKGAIDSSIKVLTKELYPKNYRINAIRPAIIMGESTEVSEIPETIQETIEKMQTGLIDLNNIAEQIAFLVSDYSSGVYGRCFDVRGYLS